MFEAFVGKCDRLNCGNLAGRKGGGYNLGEEGSPFQMTTGNVMGLIGRAQQVLNEAGEFSFLNKVREIRYLKDRHFSDEEILKIGSDRSSFFTLLTILARGIPSWMIDELQGDSFKLRGFDFRVTLTMHLPTKVDFSTGQLCYYLFFGFNSSIKIGERGPVVVIPDYLGQIYGAIVL